MAIITPTTGSSGSSAQVQRSDAKGTIDKDSFLKLFVAQYKNQDPTNAQDSSQMASQLAQFSSLEQLVNLNAAEQKVVDAITANSSIGGGAYATSLIGKRIVAVGDQVQMNADGNGQFMASVGGNGGAAKVLLKDDTGATIATVDLGKLASGEQVVDLKGVKIPAGVYHASLQVTGADGANVTSGVAEIATIDSIKYTNGLATLIAGSLQIPLSNVGQVYGSSSAQ